MPGTVSGGAKFDSSNYNTKGIDVVLEEQAHSSPSLLVSLVDLVKPRLCQLLDLRDYSEQDSFALQIML